MALLETRGLSVRFGGNLAVSSVDLDVDAGHVTGLIGPNGAGKTTTFNMICGVLAPSSGTVSLDGIDISRLGTHHRARRGIGRTFQRLEVFSSMTVRENVLVGGEIRQGWSRNSPAGSQLLSPENEPATVDDETDLILERLGLTDVADVRVGTLSTGRARLVELGRALAIRPRVLLLDEPASGLDDTETESFGDLLRELASAGLAILLVEHDVPLVMQTCDRIFVLDFGRIIASGEPEDVQRNQAVLDAYLGAAG
ncbi:MAG: ABC transporter ATP-binding protein [Microthrixaceae bacterium]